MVLAVLFLILTKYYEAHPRAGNQLVFNRGSYAYESDSSLIYVLWTIVDYVLYICIECQE